MARYGLEPGDRGSLDVRTTYEGVVQGFFVPKEAPAAGTAALARLCAGVKLIEADPAEGRLTIYPTDTRSWSEDFLGPKYSRIESITLPAEVEADIDIFDTLEELPSGFIKDYEYGLGLTRNCDVLIELVEDSANCTRIVFLVSGDTEVNGDEFRISFTQFHSLRRDLDSIKNRGDMAIRRVKENHTHNSLAAVLGVQPLQLSLGRLPTSRWMTKVAADQEPLSDGEQDELLMAATAGMAQIATRAPAKVLRLQHTIELVSLDQLVTSYALALEAGHNEDWWQQFFEQNLFALQLLFGGPTVFIDSQVSIGEGDNAAKGKKIADYLLKESMTNNAALVEIKKPSTKLMRRRPYRTGIYGVQGEISEAVTQVLDQALQLTRHEADTKRRTRDVTWVSSAPRCFVVAGSASELDTADKKKSFNLYREHLSGVRLVTYDELLGQLVTLRDFLAAEAPGDS